MRDTDDGLALYFPKPHGTPRRLPLLWLRIRAALESSKADRPPPNPYLCAYSVTCLAPLALLVRAVLDSNASAWSPRAGNAPGLALAALALMLVHCVVLGLWARWRLRQPQGKPRRAVSGEIAGNAFVLTALAACALAIVAVEPVTHFAKDDVLHWVEVTPDRTGIAIVSDIKSGIAERFEKLLDANPTVRTVHLWSNGGLADEALRMAATIRERGLDTVAVNGCASACTIIHAAGRRKLVADMEGTLGYHSASSAVLPRHWAKFGTGARKGFLDAGYARGFVDRIETVPAYDLWEPARASLIAERAADALVPTDETMGIRWLLRLDGKKADSFVENGWLGKALDLAPEARTALLAWGVATWDATRNDQRVSDHRRAYAMRVLAAGLSSELVPDVTLKEVAPTLLAGMRAARDRKGPKAETACARIGAWTDFGQARNVLSETGKSDGKTEDRWEGIIPSALSLLPAGWDRQAVPLPAVSDPTIWAGPLPAPKESCGDLMRWYEAVVAAPEAEGAAMLRLRLAAVARGDSLVALTATAGP